ncbi:MAG: hypothetical protein ACJAVR_002834 [Paracoccaceae bacterium]|jgi:hypothetical protein
MSGISHQSAAACLVVLRIGADHRVGGWAKTARKDRDWDLVLSPYQDIPDLPEFDADAVIPLPGGKWEALHAIFTDRPEMLAGRALIWLPDDDLEGSADTVARLFAIARAQGLDLCQPALTPGSAFSHFVTVQHLLTNVRYTNFVELMAPLMTPDVMRAALPQMKGRAGAKGLDFIWHRFVRAPAGARVAVIDAAAMAHRRPLGGALAPAMAEKGRDLEDERAAFFKAHLGPRYYRTLSHGHDGPLGRGLVGRASVTLAGVLTVLLTPALWRKDALARAAKTLWAQITRDIWQGTR